MFYPLAENVHRDGILRKTTVPAPSASAEMRDRAIEYCRAIMKRFDYVGVMALELFSLDGELLANEMLRRDTVLDVRDPYLLFFLVTLLK